MNALSGVRNMTIDETSHVWLNDSTPVAPCLEGTFVICLQRPSFYMSQSGHPLDCPRDPDQDGNRCTGHRMGYPDIPRSA